MGDDSGFADQRGASFLRASEPGPGEGGFRRLRRGSVRGVLRGADGPAESASWAVFPDAVDRLLRGAVVGARDCVAGGRFTEPAVVPGPGCDRDVKRRLVQCRLEVHPEKTCIVYCKDDDRPGQYLTEQFTFLGYTFRSRRAKNRWGQYFISFIPAVSNAAATRMRQKMRRWHLPRRSDKAIDNLARVWNPVLRGWIQFYGRFYKSALYSVFRHFNDLLVRWAMRKYKRLRRHRRRATYWLGGLARREPRLLAHWHLLGLTPAAG